VARTRGSRDRQYDERRRDLLTKARARLVQPEGSRASLREIAEACGVTLPTLRHYFPRREDLILAVMEENLAQGRAHLAHMAEPSKSFADSVRDALAYTAFGFRQGLGEIHTLGLTEGLRHGGLGPAFVELVLEPSIAAVQERLDAHIASGEMRAGDSRHAALSLLSPVILAFLHQAELGGAKCHPLDIDRFLADHAVAFARAHASET
jgi:AcrR family transcriptional regulator